MFSQLLHDVVLYVLHSSITAGHVVFCVHHCYITAVHVVLCVHCSITAVHRGIWMDILRAKRMVRAVCGRKFVDEKS